MTGLRRICDEHGIVLVADEVQTGFGRTGKMFAIEHFDVEPDLICVAKSLAGGFPLSGVIGRAAIMDASDPGGLGGTYAGNPLACAAALAVLDVFEEEKLVERANALGARLKARLEAIARSNTLLPIAASAAPARWWLRHRQGARNATSPTRRRPSGSSRGRPSSGSSCCRAASTPTRSAS